MSDPAFRASMAQGMLSALGDWYPAAARDVRHALGPVFIEKLLSSARIEWVPLREHVPFADAVMRALGPDHDAFNRRLFVRQTQIPLLKGMAETMLKLFGVDMRSGLKWLPRGWDSVSRGCGTLTWAPGEGRIIGRMTLSDFPVEYMKSRSIIEQCRGTYEGAFDLFRRQGTVKIVDENLASGRAVFEFIES